MKLENIIPYVAIGGAAYVVWKLFLSSDKDQKAVETQATVKTEIQKQTQSGLKQTYPDSQYKLWSDTLQAAMFDIGTDENKIYGIIEQMKNNLDILKLVDAFGIRPYYFFGIKQGDYNLGGWFAEELSQSEITKVNSIMAANKITFKF